MYHNYPEWIDWPGCIDSGTKRIPGMATSQLKLLGTLHLQTPLRYLPFYILLLLPFPISFRAFLQKSHKKSHKLLNILPNISKPSQPSLVHHGKLQLAGAHESHRLGIRRHMVSLDPELLRRDSAPASKTSKNHQFLKEFRPFRKWRTQIAKDWCLFLSGAENISRKVHTILYVFILILSLDEIKKLPHLLGRALASIKSFRPSFQHVRQYMRDRIIQDLQRVACES